MSGPRVSGATMRVEAMVDRLLRCDDLPESGGIPTTLLIVMSYADYLAGQGVAHYGDGTPSR